MAYVYERNTAVSKQPASEPPRKVLRYQAGDTVRIVRGVDAGRTGTIIEVYPSSARPYIVELRIGWYVHFSEDHLSLAAAQPLPQRDAPLKKCAACHGDGFCTWCAGEGRVLMPARGPAAICPDCGGSGNCPGCDGTGRSVDSDTGTD